jgi:hypothetical protein
MIEDRHESLTARTARQESLDPSSAAGSRRASGAGRGRVRPVSPAGYGWKEHASQSQIGPVSAVQYALQSHGKPGHAGRAKPEICACRQADMPNSAIDLNSEPFLYKLESRHPGFQKVFRHPSSRVFRHPSSRALTAFLDTLDPRRICGCLDSPTNLWVSGFPCRFPRAPSGYDESPRGCRRCVPPFPGRARSVQARWADLQL